jgi:putative aldouronate transport system permease protein
MGDIMGIGFEKVYLMQNTLNAEVSEVIATYVYKVGLQGGKFSYAAAIGLFNQLIGIVMLLLANRIAKAVSGIAIL